MRSFCILALSLSVLTSPAAAQDDPPVSLFDQLDSMMQLFRDRLAPKMEQGLQAIEPELREFLDRMDGLVQYHAPEILPNGDILIRRRTPEGPPDHLPDTAPSSPSAEPSVTTPLEL